MPKGVGRGHVELDGLDQALVLATPGDDVLDRADLETVLLSEDLQVRHAGHRAVVVHDLADHAGGARPGEPRQVDDALGLPAADEHAAVARAEREDVARPREVLGLGRRVARDLDRARAVRCADAGRDAARGLDRDREVGPVAARVARGLRVEGEAVAVLAGEGHADQAASLARHEVDRLRRDVLREHRQVTLVLPVGVVDEDDHLPLAKLVENLGDAGDGHGWLGYGLP